MTDAQEPRCSATKLDGTPCTSRFGLQETDDGRTLCLVHREPETLRARARKGAEVANRRRAGFSAADLPSLTTFDDVIVWFEALLRAVTEGRLPQNATKVAGSLLDGTQRAMSSRSTQRVVDELSQEVERLKRELAEAGRRPSLRVDPR